MNRTTWGIVIAAILVWFAFEHGFWGFVAAAVFMIIGAILGRAADGKLDLRGVGRDLLGKSDTTSD
ncbi:MAG: hypothetical protein Q4D87_07255 [Actinomycetaceae bacterium]|nr:hypothetical protein [Actinomycetaceae bacterium]